MQSSVISKIVVTGRIQEILSWIEMKIEYNKEQPCNFGQSLIDYKEEGAVDMMAPFFLFQVDQSPIRTKIMA